MGRVWGCILGVTLAPIIRVFVDHDVRRDSSLSGQDCQRGSAAIRPSPP
jgi:hypothetical protein